MCRIISRFIAHAVLVICGVTVGLSVWARAEADQAPIQSQQGKETCFLERKAVRDKLESQGVASDIAKAQVDALTYDELKILTGRIDQLPAAGGYVLEILLTVFFILLVTNILGVTKERSE